MDSMKKSDKIQMILIYVNNKVARDIANVEQSHAMSRMLRRWTKKGLLLKIKPESNNPKDTKYKLANVDETTDI